MLGLLQYPRASIAVLALFVTAAGGLVVVGHWTAGAGLLLFGAVTAVALYWPSLALALFLGAAYLPDTLINAAARPPVSVLQGQNSGTWGQPFAGLQLSDVVLLAMFAATCLILVRLGRAAREPGANRRVPVTAWLPAVLFACWLFIEVVRNVSRYGASAPGEFRFQYLQLAVVAYLCVTARDAGIQRRLLWVMLVGTLFVPLALVPVIGAIKGWSVGPYSRFFPASVSLGIFYGAGALALAKARKVVALPTWLVAAIVGTAGVFLFLDGHRSVWMAAVAAVAIALLLRAFPRRAIRRDGVAIAAALCVSLAVSWVALVSLPVPAASSSTASANSSALSYVQARGTAYVDPSADADSSWRMAVWHSALHQIRPVPVFGVGFGGYWDFPIPSISKFPVTTQPHDVYLQTWLKTGGIGLLLYLASVAGTLLFVFRAWRRTRTSGSPVTTLLLAAGVATIISASLFMVVYSFAYTSLLWAGLALGAAATRAPERLRGA
jgi:O-antigen ligase